MYLWIRKLVVLLFGLLFFGGGIGAWFVYQHYSQRENVRLLLHDRLMQAFPNGQIDLSMAQATLVGGVQMSHLVVRMPDENGFAEALRLAQLTLYADQERLREGSLRVHKAIVKEPVLHLRQTADGKWNLMPRPGKPPQFLEPCEVLVRAGLVRLTLANPELPELEITQVEADIRCVPLARVEWDVRGRLGGHCAVTLRGHAELAEGRWVVDTAKFGPIDLEQTWEQLPDLLRERLCLQLENAMPRQVLGENVAVRKTSLSSQTEIGGLLELELNGYVQSSPETGLCCHGDITTTFEGVRLRHPALPMPVRDLHARLTLARDGLEINRARFMAGTARFDGSLSLPEWEPRTLSIRQTVKGLTFSPETMRVLPSGLRRTLEQLNPEGPVDLNGVFTFAEGRGKYVGSVHFNNNSVTCTRFPYRVDNIRGRLVSHPDDKVTIEGQGTASHQPVSLRGVISDCSRNGRLRITLSGESVPFDDTLINAMPPETAAALQKLVGSAGVADFEATLTREPGENRLCLHVEADARLAPFQCGWFPYRFDQVGGKIVVAGNETRFEDIVARNGTGEKTSVVKMSGSIVPTVDGTQVKLEFDGNQIPLDERFRQALPTAVQRAWDQIRPEGNFSSKCWVTRLPGQDVQIRLDMDPARTVITPVSFPYRLEGFQGRIHYENQQTRWQQLAARHDNTVWNSDEGRVQVEPDGGGKIVFANLRSERVPFEGGLRAALPMAMRDMLDFLSPSRPPALTFPKLEIGWSSDPRQHPEVVLDGAATFEDCDLIPSVGIKQASGRVTLAGQCGTAGRRLQGNLALSKIALMGVVGTQLAGRLDILGNEIKINILNGECFGGKIHGEVRSAGESATRCDARFMLLNASLGEYARQQWGANSTRVDGRVTGSLNLDVGPSGKPGARYFKGHGWVDMQDADIYRLPAILDILDVLGLKVPNGQVFDAVSASFTIQDQEMDVDELRLTSPSLSFTLIEPPGRIRLDDYSLAMRMGVRWAKGKIHVPLVTPLVNAASDQLLMTVKLQGSMSQLKVTPEPVPLGLKILELPGRLFDGRRRDDKGRTAPDRPAPSMKSETLSPPPRAPQ